MDDSFVKVPLNVAQLSGFDKSHPESAYDKGRHHHADFDR